MKIFNSDQMVKYINNKEVVIGKLLKIRFKFMIKR